jgi:hypothetical protein
VLGLGSAARLSRERLCDRSDSHGRPQQGRDAEVDVRGEAAIQGDLAQTVGVALGARQEAHEPEVDRLAELVHAPAGEKDVGEMRLHLLDARRGARILRVGARQGERGQLLRSERGHGAARAQGRKRAKLA